MDVVGKGLFTVLTGLSGQLWAEAADELELPFLRTVVVGDPQYQDLYCDWQGLREVEEDGVIVVRPDCYVAWRQFADPNSLDEAKSLLSDAFAQILDGNPNSNNISAFKPNFGPHLFD